MAHRKTATALLCMIFAAVMCLSACSGSGTSAASSVTPAEAASTTAEASSTPAAYSVPATAPSGPDRSLAEHGMDLVALIREMVSNTAYVSIYMSVSQEIADEFSKLAEGDYTSPKAVYKVTVPNLSVFLDTTITGAGMDGVFSDSLKAYMNGRLIQIVSSIVNNAYGATALAVASTCSATKTFVSNELTENMLYIYTFEKARPILVTFYKGEDSTVTASAAPLFAELPSPASAEDVKKLFDNRGFEIVVEQVGLISKP